MFSIKPRTEGRVAKMQENHDDTHTNDDPTGGNIDEGGGGGNGATPAHQASGGEELTAAVVELPARLHSSPVVIGRVLVVYVTYTAPDGTVEAPERSLEEVSVVHTHAMSTSAGQ